MTKLHNPNYKIVFGKQESESEGDSYNNIVVSLNLSANENGAHVGISFNIEEGYPEGQFEMNRSRASKSITIEEAEQLAKKLNCFVSRGKLFLDQYKEQQEQV